MNSYQDLKQQTLVTLREITDIIVDSPNLNSAPLLPEQQQYSEPFGLDKMELSQWLLHIYLPVAINHLTHDILDIFANIDGFSYVFEYQWQNSYTQDIKQLVIKLVDFENNMKKILALKAR